MLALSLLEPLTTCPSAISSPFSGYCFREAVSTPVCTELDSFRNSMDRDGMPAGCEALCVLLSMGFKKGGSTPPFPDEGSEPQRPFPSH